MRHLASTQHKATWVKVRQTRPASEKTALRTICSMFDGQNYITFEQIKCHTGFSIFDIIHLKPALEALLGANLTSRVDLPNPGFFVED